LKDRLVIKEIEKFKKSEEFIGSLNRLVDERVQDRLEGEVQAQIKIEREKMR